MTKTISLDEVIAQERNEWASLGSKEMEIVLDTNAFKYIYGPHSQPIAISHGVHYELRKLSDLFPPNALERLNSMQDPQIFFHFPSEEDEKLIYKALEKRPARVKKQIDIGWVDEEQIAYAIERARNNKKTIIISNDGDILGAVRELRRMRAYIKRNVLGVSIRRYLERRYENILTPHEKPYREELIRTINEDHLAA